MTATTTPATAGTPATRPGRVVVAALDGFADSSAALRQHPTARQEMSQ